MNALVQDEYGAPDAVLKYQSMPLPLPSAGEVVIEIRSSGCNPIDVAFVGGYVKDIFPASFPCIPGWDCAGKIVEIGEGVENFKEGDEVFAFSIQNFPGGEKQGGADHATGDRQGCYAEYCAVKASSVALKPKSAEFREAGCLPSSSLTAYQGLLTDAGLNLKGGQTCLIINAAGGVGSFAVPLAKSVGATVLATCSTRNLEYVNSLGADHVINYTEGSIVDATLALFPGGVDVVFDLIGGESTAQGYAALKEGGTLVSIVSFECAKDAPPGKTGKSIFVQPNGQQLSLLATMFDAGSLKIPKTTSLLLKDGAQAMADLGAHKTTGKLVLLSKPKLFVIMGYGPMVGNGAAMAFGKNGFAVALVSRTQAKLDAAAAELTAKHGIIAKGFAADLSEPASIPDVLDSIRSYFGGEIDVCLYNACETHPRLPQDLIDRGIKNRAESPAFHAGAALLESSSAINITSMHVTFNVLVARWKARENEAKKGCFLLSGGGFAINGAWSVGWSPTQPSMEIGSAVKAYWKNWAESTSVSLNPLGIQVSCLTIASVVDSSGWSGLDPSKVLGDPALVGGAFFDVQNKPQTEWKADTVWMAPANAVPGAMKASAEAMMHAWEMGDEAGYRSFVSDEGEGMQMEIPSYGLNVRGFGAIWAVRKSMGDAPIDIHTVEDVSVNGTELSCVAKVLSRKTGELQQISDVKFFFSPDLSKVVKYYQTNRDHLPLTLEVMEKTAKTMMTSWEKAKKEEYKAVVTEDLAIELPGNGLSFKGFDTCWNLRVTRPAGYEMNEHRVEDSKLESAGGNVLIATQRSVNYVSGKTVRLGECKFYFTPDGKVNRLEQDNAALPKEIVVLGSSGNVGKATLAALAGNDVPATAGVRDASAENPKNAAIIAMKGIALVQADMSKPETLGPAISEGSTVFIATPGHIDRTALAQAAVKAAVASKAGHIVVISLPVVTVKKGTIFGDQFKPIEDAVKTCGIPFTIVRLPMFMDNILGQPIKDMGAIFMPIMPDQLHDSISVKDIGCAVANVLKAPGKFAGRTLSLGGIKTTMAKTAAIYSNVLGKTVSYTQVPPQAAKESMMGSGWPEWQVDGVLELLALINEGDDSTLLPDHMNNTSEVLGRDGETEAEFMENFKGMFLAKPTIHYWHIKSRTLYINFMLAATGNLDKVTLASNAANGEPLPFPGTPEWAALPPQTKSAWNTIPTLVDKASGVYIGESGAIARWLITKFDLAPADLKLRATMEQSIEKCSDLHASIEAAHVAGYMPPDHDRTGAMDRLFAAGSKLHKLLAGIESTIEGSPFVGSSATPGDYMLAAGLFFCTHLQPDSLDGYPKCKALHDHVVGIEAVKSFVALVPNTFFKRHSD